MEHFFTASQYNEGFPEQRYTYGNYSLWRKVFLEIRKNERLIIYIFVYTNYALRVTD
jgi:hypothetical protein